MTQPIISSSYNPMVIDTNGSSIVNLHDDIGPRVLASSGKLTGHTPETTIDPIQGNLVILRFQLPDNLIVNLLIFHANKLMKMLYAFLF